MQEFSSISVSSYEAGALADQLTEQARAGWSVVAIVPTGSTVTAYLSRAADAAGDADAVETPVADTTPVESTIEPAGDAPAVDGFDSAVTDPVAEAPGWAAGGTADTAIGGADEPADTSPEDHFTVADAPAAAEPAPEPAAGPAAATTTETTAADAAGAAPAGWYADPSSRFELRYWDGGQWTEHVSRAGQQYTDPPVA